MGNKDKYLELARKVNELAKRGVDGEKVAAEHQLALLMKKHGITLEELEGEEVREFRLKVNKEDAKFFRQVVSSVDTKKRGVPGCYTGGFYYIDCTAAEFAEIEFKFKFYLPRLKATLEGAYSAFIQVNELYRFETEEETEERFKRERQEKREETEADRKAREIAEGLRKERFRKAIEG